MKNSTKSLLAVCSLLLPALGLHSQITFTNSNSNLHSDSGVSGSNSGNRSGNAVCVIDVNNDGLDDIVKLDNNRYLRIEYQQPGGSFTYQYIGDCSFSNAWGMSMADVDHNGYKDLLYNGGSQAYLFKLNATGTGFMAGSPIALPNGAIFCQNGNFMDVNNDGWEDIFMCNDVNESRIWVNDGTGNFPSEAGNGVIDFNIHPGTSAPNDESGNYGSVWTDFDNDGDVDFYIIHCRQGYSSGDVRRDNVLFKNNGNGTYTEDAATFNLKSNDQDWTGSFGDIDNDGDFDLFLSKHNTTSAYYINDGSGHFSAAVGTIAFGNMPMQSQFEDFDNDGFVDLIISGDNDHRLYRNNGNNTFTNVTPSGWTVSSTNILSFATGDLNHDGKIDVYASYGGTYNSPSSVDDVYWMNSTSNSNHFLTLVLNGTTSTVGGLGARAYIYGSWGVQTREVRASESYGTSNSFQLHFGLGAANTVDSVIVNWPSGQKSKLVCPVQADQFVNITEGGGTCTLSCTGISITPAGSTTICPGDSVMLSAPTGGGYTYLWSNGATTSSIYAGNAGGYSVVVSTGPSCSATSPTIDITINPDETPTISANGNTAFCPGGSVDITSSSASSYTWNNGASTQTITATQTGYYAVTVPGVCQNWTSDSIYVSLYTVTPPTSSDVYLTTPGATTLTASGNSISWYDMATGGTLLGTGSTYNTPVINVNTTFYAEDTYSFGGSNGYVGSIDTAAATYSTNTLNGYLIFDVTDDCILHTVEVGTNTAGSRTIELRDNVGTVLNSTTVNIPAGISTITLDFTIAPGTNYQLGTNTADNNTNFGYNSPSLIRNSSGAGYPYDYAGVLSITSGHTGTTPTTSAYYYFYNWYVEQTPDATCQSSRTPVTVYITDGSSVEEVNAIHLNVYPNPTTSYVNIMFTTTESSDVVVTITDLLGKTVKNMNLGTVNGSFNQQISLEGVAAGVYNVKLTVGEESFNTSVIVK